MTNGEVDGLATMTDGDHSLAERLAEELHRRILVGEIPVGSKLRQDVVAADFNVSRTPVREAFRVLSGQGVLEIIPRRGALVHGPTPRDIVENHEVRAELEGLAAEFAAERIDDDQLSRLREAVARFERVVELASASATAGQAAGAWREANDSFHSTLVEAADNSHLTSSIQELRRRIPHNLAFVTLASSSRLLRQNAAEHGEILAAIEARDKKKARRLAKAHVLHSAERIARRYAQELAAETRRAPAS